MSIHEPTQRAPDQAAIPEAPTSSIASALQAISASPLLAGRGPPAVATAARGIKSSEESQRRPLWPRCNVEGTVPGVATALR